MKITIARPVGGDPPKVTTGGDTRTVKYNDQEARDAYRSKLLSDRAIMLEKGDPEYERRVIEEMVNQQYPATARHQESGVFVDELTRRSDPQARQWREQLARQSADLNGLLDEIEKIEMNTGVATTRSAPLREQATALQTKLAETQDMYDSIMADARDEHRKYYPERYPTMPNTK